MPLLDKGAQTVKYQKKRPAKTRDTKNGCTMSEQKEVIDSLV
jgi:hypothetical protein